MNPRVTEVKPNADYTLILTFTNGEVKVFDVTPYLDIGIFRELKSKRYFNAVRPFLGSIQWPNGQDFCPDTLYLNSSPLALTSSSHPSTHRPTMAEHPMRTSV
ncbi:MAG: DUF2442 domain-containing protein [Ardenticatenaceae bacterium]